MTHIHWKKSHNSKSTKKPSSPSAVATNDSIEIDAKTIEELSIQNKEKAHVNSLRLIRRFRRTKSWDKDIDEMIPQKSLTTVKSDDLGENARQASPNNNMRMRANTEPIEGMQEGSRSPGGITQAVSMDKEDEELRLAQAIALAIQSNPNMAPNELKAMMEQLQQQNSKQSVGSGTSSTSSGLTTDKKNQQKASRFKGRFAEMFVGNTSAHGTATVATTNDKSATAAEGPLSSTSTSSSHVRLPFRSAAAKSPRSPPMNNLYKANSTETPPTVATSVAPTAPFLPVASNPGTMVSTMLNPLRLAGTRPVLNSGNKAIAAPIRLTGIAWKRRGGMGKYSTTSPWERRRFELQGTRICYYATNSQEGEVGNDDLSAVPSKDDMDDAALASEGIVVTKRANWLEQATSTWTAAIDDPTAPRGYLDLGKEYTAMATMGQSGAPSPFALSIKQRGETRWKMCFDYHRDQMEWLAALTDVIVQASIDSYNANLLEAADPRNQEEVMFFHPPMVHEPPTDSEENKQTHRLWMMDAYSVCSPNQNMPNIDDESSEDESDSAEFAGDNLEATNRSHISINDKVIDQLSYTVGKIWTIPEQNLWYLFGIVNITLAYTRSSSATLEGFWYIIVLANAGVYMCMAKQPNWHEVLTKCIATLQSSIIPSVKETKKTNKIIADKVAVVEPENKIATGKNKPIAGSTAVRLENPTDLPVNSKNHVFGGWRAVPGDSMLVRSHGYSSTKAKVPSPGELYECVHIDMFESPQVCFDMASKVKLPEVNFTDEGPKTWRSPDIFIVNFALPTDPPKLGRTSNDGGGYIVTMYYKMKQATRDILRRVTAEDYIPENETQPEDPQKSIVNAVRLLEEWVRRAPTDPKWFARFKVVPNALNLKEIGMPSWIAKYNGKPFLIKRPGTTGFIHNHPELSCLEFDISLHPFPYLAKQGICFMKDSYFKKILVNVGFTIEGKTDDELPECILGLMQLCYPDPMHAIQAGDLFAGTSPKSYD